MGKNTNSHLWGLDMTNSHLERLETSPTPDTAARGVGLLALRTPLSDKTFFEGIC